MQIGVAQHMVNSSTAKRTIVIRGGGGQLLVLRNVMK